MSVVCWIKDQALSIWSTPLDHWCRQWGHGDQVMACNADPLPCSPWLVGGCLAAAPGLASTGARGCISLPCIPIHIHRLSSLRCSIITRTIRRVFNMSWSHLNTPSTFIITSCQGSGRAETGQRQVKSRAKPGERQTTETARHHKPSLMS